MERPFISDILQRSIVQQDPKRHTNTPNHTNTNAYIPRSPLRGVCQLGDMEIRAPTIHPQQKLVLKSMPRWAIHITNKWTRTFLCITQRYNLN